ncbi:Uncharacterised protein [Chlamydia trachomatis]|nr:Uncharacterised protein [Chlamydia trachomatis]
MLLENWFFIFSNSADSFFPRADSSRQRRKLTIPIVPVELAANVGRDDKDIKLSNKNFFIILSYKKYQ